MQIRKERLKYEDSINLQLRYKDDHRDLVLFVNENNQITGGQYEPTIWRTGGLKGYIRRKMWQI